jgi:hypothetical protein
MVKHIPTAVSAACKISRPNSVRLLADLLADAEAEVSKLRTLLVTHFCTCRTQHADRLDVAYHPASCRYRKLLS